MVDCATKYLRFDDFPVGKNKKSRFPLNYSEESGFLTNFNGHEPAESSR
jgi:hypothetical protein